MELEREMVLYHAQGFECIMLWPYTGILRGSKHTRGCPFHLSSTFRLSLFSFQPAQTFQASHDVTI
jgi:hypothetical protein